MIKKFKTIEECVKTLMVTFSYPVAVKYLNHKLSLLWPLGASGREAFLSVLLIFQLSFTLRLNPKNSHSINYVRMATKFTTSGGAPSRNERCNGPTSKKVTKSQKTSTL